MPSNCYIKEKNKFLHIHLTGYLSDQNKIENLADILHMIDEECTLSGLDKAMVVWEIIDSMPTLQEYQKAISYKFETPSTINSIAFIYVFPKSYKSEYLEIVLANRKGHNIKSFSSEQEAEDWLKYEKETQKVLDKDIFNS